MKNIWIIANFKSHKSLAQSLEWVEAVGPKIVRQGNLKVVVCPTFTSLEEIKKKIQSSNFPLLVGSQDLSPFDEGAYTGEEAASILKQYVDLAILGHSERRQNFNETDEAVALKVKQAKEHDIIPLVCLQSVDTPIPSGCKLTAYEPIEAIGTGHPDTPDNAEKVAVTLKQKYGQDLEVLYGGSVTSENCKSFILQESISGLLIGGASLDATEFVKIVNESTL